MKQEQSRDAISERDRFPGTGRGPVGKQAIIVAAPSYIDLSDWAPACAGEASLEELQDLTKARR